MYVLVRQTTGGELLVDTLDDAGLPIEASRHLTLTDFRSFVSALEAPTCEETTHESATPRWVWEDTARIYSLLLTAGIRVQRCHDLRLCHVILKNSALTTTSELARTSSGRWDVASAVASDQAEPRATLFDFEAEDDGDPVSRAGAAVTQNPADPDTAAGASAAPGVSG